MLDGRDVRRYLQRCGTANFVVFSCFFPARELRGTVQAVRFRFVCSVCVGCANVTFVFAVTQTSERVVLWSHLVGNWTPWQGLMSFFLIVHLSLSFFHIMRALQSYCVLDM